MESGAKGCEVVVSGKLRGQRAKSMKFVDGLMIHSGEPTNDYVNYAVRHVLLRQGELSGTAFYGLHNESGIYGSQNDRINLKEISIWSILTKTLQIGNF